jgi:deoxyribonuclease-4
MNHKLGAHVSIGGGYHNAVQKIKEMEGNTLQIFSSSPRGWSFAKPEESAIELFKNLKKENKIDPVYFHASYLINLGTDERLGQVSRSSLKHELNLASRMGVKGSIVHLGSFKYDKDLDMTGYDVSKEIKYSALINNISEVLKDTPENTIFMIENAGTRKIGRTIEEIAQIIKDVNHPRLRVCLDTCHLHAAGYDITTKDKLDAFLEKFDSLIGLQKLELWHVNDSKDPFGSLRDRHENIGKGMVGVDTFRGLLNHPKLKDLSFIIETPGFDDKGPDKQNLDILKGLI